MSYDRFGRTPEQARRERIQTWVTVGMFGVMVAGIVTCAALIVMMLA